MLGWKIVGAGIHPGRETGVGPTAGGGRRRGDPATAKNRITSSDNPETRARADLVAMQEEKRGSKHIKEGTKSAMPALAGAWETVRPSAKEGEEKKREDASRQNSCASEVSRSILWKEKKGGGGQPLEFQMGGRGKRKARQFKKKGGPDRELLRARCSHKEEENGKNQPSS